MHIGIGLVQRASQQDRAGHELMIAPPAMRAGVGNEDDLFDFVSGRLLPLVVEDAFFSGKDTCRQTKKQTSDCKGKGPHGRFLV